MIAAHNGEKNIPDCVEMFPSGKFAIDFVLLSSYILFITGFYLYYIYILFIYWIFRHSCHFPEVCQS